MTCLWPDCSEPTRCAQCLVLDQCRAQVPLDDWSRNEWVVLHGYMTISIGSRESKAMMVADRLIKWLEWPGDPCGGCTGCRTRSYDMDPLVACLSLSPHPLDGTKASELRFVVSAPCKRCAVGDWCDRRSPPLYDHLQDYPCGKRDIDWTAVAIICDELERAGMWGDVHAWGPRNPYLQDRALQILNEFGPPELTIRKVDPV
jgi:hypothetical protein